MQRMGGNRTVYMSGRGRYNVTRPLRRTVYFSEVQSWRYGTPTAIGWIDRKCISLWRGSNAPFAPYAPLLRELSFILSYRPGSWNTSNYAEWTPYWCARLM